MLGEHGNAETCLARDWGELNLTEFEGWNRTNGNHTHCPPVWDGFSCWRPTLAGTTASSKCPFVKGSDITKRAFRLCSSLSKWLNKDGSPGVIGWTNYTQCLTPAIREVLRMLGSDNDALSKMRIAENTRLLEFIGLSLSLITLLLSLLVFSYFRTLRNSRTRIHCHLFLSMVVQVGIRLVLYTDQAITRYRESTDNENDLNISSVAYHRGIDNTPILCEAGYICLEYARTAMFMWTFVEGLFIHNMVTVNVFEDKIYPRIYIVIGWVIPVPLVIVWATVTHFQYGLATCWWGYSFTIYFWILEGPRLAVLLINLLFLLSILRVLIMKLRQSSSTDVQLALKAVKATLLLIPLLGITNLLNIIPAPLEKSPAHFALWSYTTHALTSTQGFVLAFLYCFKNGEVHTAIRNKIRAIKRRRLKRQNLEKTFSPLPVKQDAAAGLEETLSSAHSKS